MEEREIDLLDMIADILSHWKGLLVALIIGAVLMGGFSYVKSYRSVQEAQPVDEEKTELDETVIQEQLALLEKELEESQMAAVMTTIDDEREFAWKKKYAQEAAYMQIDPFNVAQRQLVYRIGEGEDNHLQGLGAVYGDILNNVGLYEWVEEKTGIPTADVSSLVGISVTSSTPFANGEMEGVFGTDSLKITVSQKDEEACIKLAEAVKAYVEQQSESVAEKLGEHELILLSESAGTVTDIGLMNRQVDYGNAVSSLRSSIASAKAGFTDDQTEYYKLLTWEEGIDQVEADESTTEEQLVEESPSVSKKYILLGAVLFAFLYAGILFLMYIFNSKKFIIDKWIDDLRHYGKRRFNAEQSVELAFAAVKIATVKNHMNSICLMGCNLSAGAGNVCESLKAALEKEGISVTVLDNVLYNAEAMEKVDAMTGVVLVEKAGSTLYNEIASELALLKRQDIAVLGGIVVE